MLGWIARLFRRRDDRRDIFRFWDGARWRAVDPLPASRALDESLGQRVGEVLALLTTPPPPDPPNVDVSAVRADYTRRQTEAALQLADAAGKAFGVLPFDGAGGLTEAERIRLATRFLVFLHGLAEDARPFASWPAAGSPSTPPASPTPPSSGSGTTGGPSPASTPSTSPAPSPTP